MAIARAPRQASRRASAPAVPPTEVIELSDSDEEEAQQPPPSLSGNTPKVEQPEPIHQRTLPRRKGAPPVAPQTDPPAASRAAPPASAPTQTYKEVNNYIVIDSSDEDEPPRTGQLSPKKPPSTQRQHSSAQRNVPDPSSSSINPIQEQLPNTQVQLHSAPPPEERGSSTAAPPPLDDVDMIDSPLVMTEEIEPPGTADFEMVDAESEAMQEPGPERGTKPQFPLSSESITLAGSQSISHEGQSQENPTTSNQPTGTSKAPQPLELRMEECTTPDSSSTPSSTPLLGSSMRSPPEPSGPSCKGHPRAPTSPVQTPPLAHMASLRAETASPVSAVLDPGLQSLVISGSSPETSGPLENARSPSNGSTATRSSEPSCANPL